MKKKLCMLLICLLCLLAPAAGVFASDASQKTDWICGVYDKADLLTESEESSLLSTMAKYNSKYSTDIAIVTTSSAGGKTAQAYADAFAEDIGMSMTRNGPAGILFLIDMDNREIYIATQGQAIYYYSEARIESILDDCYNRIIGQDYAGTCRAFLGGVRAYMGKDPSEGARSGPTGILIRLVIALVGGGAITGFMVAGAGGRVTTGAGTYYNAAGSNIYGKRDMFINRTVTRRRIQRDPPKTGSSGGFSSSGGGGFHMSSGGGAHGGGGRKF